MTSNITIRDYRDSDLDGVIALSRELQGHEIQFDDRFKPVSDIGSSHVDFMKSEIAKYNGRFLLATSEDVIVGFAALYLDVVSEEEPSFKGHMYSNVEFLVVAHTSRGQGVGKRLLDQCEKLARAAGRPYLQLNVLSENSEAKRFYRREGFNELFVKMEKKL
jgi:ribosomal protein S18 acetylase RimI-like enzyme